MPGDIKPNQRRKHKTRQDIIDTTHAIIVAHGIEGVSIRAVADRIDYSPAALYRYFISKDELVDAVRAQCFDRLNTEIMSRIQESTDPAEQLLLGGMTYVEYARQNPADYLLMFRLDPSPSTQAENREMAMRALLFLLRNGIEMGAFHPRPDYDETAILYHCWGVVHGLAMLESTAMPDEQATIAAITPAILRSVINGFSTPG